MHFFTNFWGPIFWKKIYVYTHYIGKLSNGRYKIENSYYIANMWLKCISFVVNYFKVKIMYYKNRLKNIELNDIENLQVKS